MYKKKCTRYTASSMSTRRCAAKHTAASLGALVVVCLLRCSGAFFVTSTDARKGALPGNKPAGHGSLVAQREVAPDAKRPPRGPGLSAFGGESDEWDGAEDRAASLGGAVVGASSSFVVQEAAVDGDGEEEKKEVMALASAKMGADGGGATVIEASGTGEEGGGGGGRWQHGLSKAGRTVARVLLGGDLAGGGGRDQMPQQMTKEVVVPQDIPALDTEAFQLWADAMLRDGKIGRHRRVLILVSDTEGGHRASTEALEAAFENMYQGMIGVDIVDISSQHAPWPLNTFVGVYQFMAKHPLIWKTLWEYGRFPPTRKLFEELMYIQCHKWFQAMFEAYKPGLVLSLNPLCQEVPLRVLKEMGGGTREISFVTVVTDLGGAHPTWFHRDVDVCFVPSERLAILARKCGLTPDQVRLHGLLLGPGFWNEQSAKIELQAKLGLKPGVKACLVMGGRDGVGGLESIVGAVGRRLGQEKRESQVVVVCGKNSVAKASLESANWAPNVHMHVKGFVSNMDEWMGAVDCIVTKAGPATIAEATTRGLPIMLSTFSPGQEEGNVPYVVEGGFGSFGKKPAKIADTISNWLRDDELLARMSVKAQQASRPMATYDICQDIGNMLFSWKDFVLDAPDHCI